MSAHTPGPWTIGGKGKFLNQVEINPAIGCAYGAGAEVIANAHLIASAPDLLEALIHMVTVAERDGWQTAVTGRQLFLRDAKVAIAKAKGKTP